MTCGYPSHSSIDISRLSELGRSLDSLQSLSVFTGGLVGFPDETESEVIKHVAGKEGRSSARPRPGRRTAHRSWRRPAGKADYFRSDALEEAFGTGFRVLAQHYAALAFEDPNGLWVAARSNPLGLGGPQLHFLTMFPTNPRLGVRAWAFKAIGPNAKLMPLKHTNFPDASICAFSPDDGSWSPSDGMLALMDHYTIWGVKSLHRQIIGYWPGRQAGPSAYYRRMEFKSEEWCGCGSDRRYRDCHQGSDLLLSDEFAHKEFHRMYRCSYYDRQLPAEIEIAAKSRWNNLPSILFLSS